MERSVDSLDLSSLPEHAKIELLDFYEFLCKKYGELKLDQKFEDPRSRLKKFLSEPVFVQKIQSFSREELHDRQ